MTMALERVVRKALAAIPLVFLAEAGCGSCEDNDPVAKRTDYEKPVVEVHRDNIEKVLIPNEVDPKVQEFLQDPFKIYQEEKLFEEGIRISILSLTAEGLVNISIDNEENVPYAKEGIQKIIETALDKRVSPYDTPLSKVSNLGNRGLYLAHLNIILGAYKRITGNDTYKDLNQRISEYLAEKTQKDPEKHIRSYGIINKKDIRGKWPSDQAGALYSLYLYDQNYSSQISKKPIEEWLAYMRTKGNDPETGLHKSEITGTWEYGKYPRGCAMSLTIIYMARFAPEDANELWKNYKDHFKVSVGIGAGFREYPKGVERKPDFDSGPIIGGVGATATAFAIGASRAIGDDTTYYQLKAVESVGMLGANSDADETITKVANSLVAKASQFHNDTITPWY